MRLMLVSILLAIGAAVLPGCASDAPQANDGRIHAECKVCKHNADLGCVDIVVDASTPHCSRNGKEYYFCSDSCCKKFQKNPAKFANE